MPRTAAALLVATLLVVSGCVGSSGSGGSVGLSVGGAQDANAFRDNVHNGYVPQPTDVTSEGLFHDYYFDTGQSQPCEERFCPSYSRATSTDPLSNASERYLAVGLNSGIAEADFERKKLNLVVVVDMSGSMSDGIRRYHYDGDGTSSNPETTTKMSAARSALRTLVGHLGPEDRLGVVAYDDDARVVREFGAVGESGSDVNGTVGGLEAGGGTNLDAAMRTADLLVEDRAGEEGYETRVVYITDAMPNVGDTGSGSLHDRLAENADAGVHTTFVGVGVDFNTELTESITSVRGANYYAVHSAESFRDRMSDGFDHMVTPMAFDLTVTVDSDAYEIDTVYGSPEADAATGEVMRANTLFPSRTEGNRTEGGVVLLRLERTGPGDTLDLNASYETPSGERRSSVRTVTFPDGEADSYDTDGVRKAVVLARHADLLSNWAAYERVQASGGEPETPAAGIESRELGTWEQRSVELRVSGVYRDRIAAFADYFEREMDALGAERMRRDLVVLRTLVDHGNVTAGPSSDG